MLLCNASRSRDIPLIKLDLFSLFIKFSISFQYREDLDPSLTARGDSSTIYHRKCQMIFYKFGLKQYNLLIHHWRSLK